MKRLIMMIVTMMMVANLFAGTAIYKAKKADGSEQKIIFDTNEKIANMITFLYSVGSPVEKVTIQTKGTGTFKEASAEKPYYCIRFKNTPNVKMFMWKSDFEEIMAEMKGENK